MNILTNGIVKVKRKSDFNEFKKNKLLYLMFVPAALYFFVLSYIPMPGIVIAFKNYTFSGGLFGSPWNGFDNFKYFIQSGKLWQVTLNTTVYNLGFLASNTVFSILAAILISEMIGKYFKKAAQTVMFLPHFISWVIVSAFFYNLFNYDYGVINNFLIGIGAQKIDIYSNPNMWPLILTVLYVWKGIGLSSVLYLSAIMGLDRESFESARIDGANEFQIIWDIVLPMLKPTIITLVLLGLSRIMRGEFDMFYQLVGNNSRLLDKTDIIDTLVFRSMVATSDFGMASAAGFYQSVLCFVFIVSVNWIVKKINEKSALF